MKPFILFEVNSGIVETTTAATPEETPSDCARATLPVPPTRSSVPMSAELRHSTGIGLGTPRTRKKPYSRPPATKKRPASIVYGGMVSMANRVAR